MFLLTVWADIDKRMVARQTLWMPMIQRLSSKGARSWNRPDNCRDIAPVKLHARGAAPNAQKLKFPA
jgi:hypothetical protein